ncbi:alpha/beta hydrolase [Pseudonocardia broussonetiae]|uniref:Alpha/beta hydrolase n=1 Tax=Pseudonocardia broussonetiae TaxID=2736640 RepID=A0A6M6JFC8_9PSEU|nr:alpha/beta hydrolase [Pseudonocardia broussonetiae]QJY45795.1 alpha/beta hydrolase [Pseudonocardia broussonetiae]
MDVVLVPGANHGGWWYRPVVEELEARGHRAHAVTLDGLDPADPEPDRLITLDTHVRQLVDVVSALPGPAVVLGHSYAGSVLSGAADVVPDRFRSLLYVDAFVPDDGESCWSMTLPWEREWFVEGSGRTGAYVDPLPFFDDRADAHPLATLTQRSRLTGAWRTVADKHYVLAASAEWAARSPFVAVADRLRADPSWVVHDLDETHNVLRTGPDALVGVLDRVLGSA